jgi:hypothetical protein
LVEPVEILFEGDGVGIERTSLLGHDLADFPQGVGDQGGFFAAEADEVGGILLVQLAQAGVGYQQADQMEQAIEGQ